MKDFIEAVDIAVEEASLVSLSMFENNMFFVSYVGVIDSATTTDNYILFNIGDITISIDTNATVKISDGKLFTIGSSMEICFEE